VVIDMWATSELLLHNSQVYSSSYNKVAGMSSTSELARFPALRILEERCLLVFIGSRMASGVSI
jgi:hypothetical protein